MDLIILNTNPIRSGFIYRFRVFEVNKRQVVTTLSVIMAFIYRLIAMEKWQFWKTNSESTIINTNIVRTFVWIEIRCSFSFC